jgi:hypothetical protein
VPLNLTSCTRVHEPGFSRSECLELARRFELGTGPDQLQCDRWNCDGRVDSDNDLTPRQKNTIVAALRAFAE